MKNPDLSSLNFSQGDYLPPLEIDPVQVNYYGNISDVFNLSSTQWEYISKNGFVVVHTGEMTTFEEAYSFYWKNDLPVVITTDTILNTFHLLFDEFLKKAENETLRPIISEMTSELLAESARIREGLSPALQEAMSQVVVFFGVAAELIETGDEIPAYAQEHVNSYVEKIMIAEDLDPVPPQKGQGYIKFVDYSQYKPRGHYAGNPYLEKYFRTMMWYGRREYDANETDDLLQTCLISLVLVSSGEALTKWQKVYDITSYLVGRSDSLNHYDIMEAMNTSLGGAGIELLGNPENVLRVKEELSKDKYYRPRILSNPVYKDPSEMYRQLVFPKIFQFMGQRYIPDSEIMQSVMYDRVRLFNDERRGLPSSLDVMAAFGSSRAVLHLKGELERYNYSRQLAGAIESVRNKTEDYWNQSVFFDLMRSYGELSSKENESYPDFMRTASWADEKLNTALGSYAELKHDTVLYGKQSYSLGISCGTPDGIVEPYPRFYARMENLSTMMRDIVVQNFDPDGAVGRIYAEVFEDFARINRNLTRISVHELEGVPLSEEDGRFVREVYYRIYVGCGRALFPGWLSKLIEKADVSAETKDSRIVADIANDSGTEIPVPSPPRVLHVATGYVRTLIVANEKPDGNLSFFVGPVYSFYEFHIIGFERLNDEEWRDVLTSEGPSLNPFWTQSFLA